MVWVVLRTWWFWVIVVAVLALILTYPFCRSAVINCITEPCPQEICESLLKRILN